MRRHVNTVIIIRLCYTQHFKSASTPLSRLHCVSPCYAWCEPISHIYKAYPVVAVCTALARDDDAVLAEVDQWSSTLNQQCQTRHPPLMVINCLEKITL